jgi:thymidylate synthase (FAD)
MNFLSKPEVTLIDQMGTDLTVVNAARVSFEKESDWEEKESDWEEGGWYLPDADKKLINYLAKHNHWTPFGHITAQFRIKAPVYVARQLVKHQVGLVWNEVSRRYVDSEPEFFIPMWRKRPEGSVKQGSGGEFDRVQQNQFSYWLSKSCEEAHETYKDLLGAGVAPEQARMVLPLNHATEWYWTGSVAAFARVCKLRLDPHSQEETQDVAKKIDEALKQAFPVSWNALMEN